MRLTRKAERVDESFRETSRIDMEYESDVSETVSISIIINLYYFLIMTEVGQMSVRLTNKADATTEVCNEQQNRYEIIIRHFEKCLSPQQGAYIRA
jgi:hypothetical protein